MALEQSTDKIPIRIIRSRNHLGKLQDEIVMDCSSAISFGPKIRTKMRKFKKRYSKLLDDVKKLSKKGKRKQSSDYWVCLCCRIGGIFDSLSWHGSAFSLASSVYPCAMLGMPGAEE